MVSQNTQQENLIFLIFSNGIVYLTDKLPEEIIIDVGKRTWTFRGQTIEFGRAVEFPWRVGHTPLGVYDKTDPNHLRQMLVDYRRIMPPRIE